MKQSLSLNLKQKLLMTPKLQQSINILQLSAHELGELIEKEYYFVDKTLMIKKNDVYLHMLHFL